MYYFVLDQHLFVKIKDEIRHLKPCLLDLLISSTWLHVKGGENVENYGQLPARRPEGTIAGVKMAFDLSDPLHHLCVNVQHRERRKQRISFAWEMLCNLFLKHLQNVTEFGNVPKSHEWWVESDRLFAIKLSVGTKPQRSETSGTILSNTTTTSPLLPQQILCDIMSRVVKFQISSSWAGQDLISNFIIESWNTAPVLYS